MSRAEKNVYFLRPIGMEGPVKIGCSCQPAKRLKALDLFSPFPLELAAIAHGTNSDERALHWRFRDTRMHGEWFAASQELSDLIEEVAATGVLPALEPAPYGKTGKGRGDNPGRNPAWKEAKCKLTQRIARAERHAHGYRFQPAWRPEPIRRAIASYQGGHEPPPSGEVLAVISAYIDGLLAQPKFAGTWREGFDAYTLHRIAHAALTERAAA